MTIKREDLVAAANAGVLHYAEVDSLLIFLAQREINAKKQSAQQNAKSFWQHSYWMYYLGGMLAIGVATLLGMHFISENVVKLGVVAALWFTVIYALCAIGATAWFGIRRGNVLLGMFSVLVIALMPLVIVGLQQRILLLY